MFRFVVSVQNWEMVCIYVFYLSRKFVGENQKQNSSGRPGQNRVHVQSVAFKNPIQQESIPVGCVPPTCQLYFCGGQRDLSCHYGFHWLGWLCVRNRRRRYAYTKIYMIAFLPFANEVAERLCFYTCLSFCSRGGGLSRPRLRGVSAQGGVQAHAWGVSRPMPGGVSRPMPRGCPGPGPGVYSSMH